MTVKQKQERDENSSIMGNSEKLKKVNAPVEICVENSDGKKLKCIDLENCDKKTTASMTEMAKDRSSSDKPKEKSGCDEDTGKRKVNSTKEKESEMGKAVKGERGKEKDKGKNEKESNKSGKDGKEKPLKEKMKEVKKVPMDRCSYYNMMEEVMKLKRRRVKFQAR